MEEDGIRTIAQVVGGILSWTGETLKNLGDAIDQDPGGSSPVPGPVVGGAGNVLKTIGDLIGHYGFGE